MPLPFPAPDGQPLGPVIPGDWIAHDPNATGKALEVVIGDDLIFIKLDGAIVCAFFQPDSIILSDMRHHDG